MVQLTREQLDSFKERVSEELTKRGFHVTLEVNEERCKYDGESKIIITSNNFQTVPVLFKKLAIVNFNTSVKKQPINEIFGDGDGDCFVVDVGVYVGYEHFDVGSNCSQLFHIHCVFMGTNERLFKVKIN
jgi:hypothetical protein